MFLEEILSFFLSKAGFKLFPIFNAIVFRFVVPNIFQYSEGNTLICLCLIYIIYSLRLLS